MCSGMNFYNKIIIFIRPNGNILLYDLSSSDMFGAYIKDEYQKHYLKQKKELFIGIKGIKNEKYT